jgi:hypothetical protein
MRTYMYSKAWIRIQSQLIWIRRTEKETTRYLVHYLALDLDPKGKATHTVPDMFLVPVSMFQ